MKENVVFHLEDNNANDDGPSFFDGVIMNNKDLKDEDLDEIIKELETSTVLSEIKLLDSLITLADGRFTAALASNTSLLKVNLHDNKIGDEGAQSLASALKVNNTLRCVNLSGNQISKVGAQIFAEALMVNTVLEIFYLSGNKIGDEGMQSLAMSLKVINTLRSIDLCGCQISKVGVKFLASALIENTSLLFINLSNNLIYDEGAQSLAESFTENRSLCNIQLSSNGITDIGATQLADAIELNGDCVVTKINLNGKKVSIGLLDMIESICKAKQSSKGKDLSSNDITQIQGKKARNKKRKLQINGTTASKDDQITALKELLRVLRRILLA